MIVLLIFDFAGGRCALLSTVTDMGMSEIRGYKTLKATECNKQRSMSRKEGTWIALMWKLPAKTLSLPLARRQVYHSIFFDLGASTLMGILPW